MKCNEGNCDFDKDTCCRDCDRLDDCSAACNWVENCEQMREESK